MKNELFELCLSVNEATGWETDNIIYRDGNIYSDDTAWLYDTDYLLSKLPPIIKRQMEFHEEQYDLTLTTGARDKDKKYMWFAHYDTGKEGGLHMTIATSPLLALLKLHEDGLL